MPRIKSEEETAASRRFRRVVGKRIKHALDRKNMSQKELAAEMDVDPAQVSQWISGTSGVSLYRLSRIAQITGVGGQFLLPSPLRTRNSPDQLGEELVTKIGVKRAEAVLKVPDARLKKAIDEVIGTYIMDGGDIATNHR